jgi:hypothetical protein
MKLDSNLGRIILAALLVLCIACAKGSMPTEEQASPTPGLDDSGPTVVDTSPLDAWWSNLSALCGNAYAGTLTSADAADSDLAGELMTMHVRRCEANRLEIPFHIGENRSRTWVLTRSDKGFHLQHDHRHEDGSEDSVTLYGGLADSHGTEIAQYFPADEYSKQLFEANELTASVANVWSMEIVPGERFSYILRRPERHFQVDFDLERTVEPPPAP